MKYAKVCIVKKLQRIIFSLEEEHIPVPARNNKTAKLQSQSGNREWTLELRFGETLAMWEGGTSLRMRDNIMTYQIIALLQVEGMKGSLDGYPAKRKPASLTNIL